MKCPKCGYLGFETTDRCRNCQYDFSLAPFVSELDLALHHNGAPDPAAPFELPPIAHQSEHLTASSLDLDRLFGDPEQADLTTARKASEPAAHSPSTAVGASPHEPMSRFSPEQQTPAVAVAADLRALPFDDVPLRPPPAARPPLAVRRATSDVPRNRPRTTRPVRTETSLEFDADAAPPARTAPGPVVAEAAVPLKEAPALGLRLGAGVIDLVLLLAIDAVVTFLTLRVAGLQTTPEDLRVLPVVPFAAFLAILGFGYVASFTVAGGQTIGKMLFKLRVIGDDGRPVDAAGGLLRAVGCMLVPITLGLSYVPVLFSCDHRALHDRLAGTRVVRE